MNAQKFFDIATTLSYGQLLGISHIDINELYNEFSIMCDYEYEKSPQHYMFKEHYIDKIHKIGDKYYNFIAFAHYYLSPWIIHNKCDILINYCTEGIILTKKYIGCEHEFRKEQVIFTPTITETTGIVLPDRYVCNKCGYQQK